MHIRLVEVWDLTDTSGLLDIAESFPQGCAGQSLYVSESLVQILGNIVLSSAHAVFPTEMGGSREVCALQSKWGEVSQCPNRAATADTSAVNLFPVPSPNVGSSTIRWKHQKGLAGASLQTQVLLWSLALQLSPPCSLECP